MTVQQRLVRLAKPLVSRVPALATAYRYLRDHRAPNSVPPMSPMGFRFGGHDLMASGSFEVTETALVRRILRDVDLFVNVGANVGYYCCIALQDGKDAVAFEPITGNLRHLYANVRANGWGQRIEVWPVALADKADVVQIFGGGVMASLVSGWSGTPASYVDTVACSTLDRLALPRLVGRRALLLVDVEGAEEALLRGASACLGLSPKPIWLVEVCIDEHLPAGTQVNPQLVSTFDHFWRNGYVAWTAQAQPQRVTPEQIHAIAAGGRNTLPTHNFLFVEAGFDPAVWA